MKKNFSLVLGAVAAVIFAVSQVQAETHPVQLAVFEPVQIFSAEESISGLRLNLLYGRNDSVTGLDLGLVGVADSDFTGWQYNFGANITKGNFSGLQMGVVNYANSAKGVQLGLINYAVSLNGVQIGLINIIRGGGMFPVFPIINWSFQTP